MIMLWVFLSLFAAAALAAVNHIDKHLISEYFDGQASGALIIFSTIVAIPLLPILYFLDPTVLSIPLYDAGILLASGILIVIGYLLYLYALEQGEVSIVGPLWLLVPVFTFVLGYMLLNETYVGLQFLGAGLVLLGSFILALELAKEEEEEASDTSITFLGLAVNWVVLGLMSLTALIMALGNILFKASTIELTLITGLFWFFLAFVICSVVFLLIPSYRRQFWHALTKNGKGVLRWSVVNEALNISGEIALLSALLMTSAANAALLSDGFQPFFVIAFAMILTWWGIEDEKVYKHHLIHKLASVIIMVFGTWLLLTP